MSEESGLYKVKMALFDNGKPKEFLLLLWNFQMTVKASGALDTSTNILHLCTLLYGKALRQIDTLSIDVGSTTTTHLNCIILGLGTPPPY